MTFHVQQAVRALILLAFSCLILKLHITGEITKFINPKYEPLSQSASVLFLILFFVQIKRIWTVKEHHHNHSHHEDHNCSHHHDHGDSPFNIKKLISYIIIAVPLITGFLLPAKVLDASIVDKKGGMAILASQKQSSNEDTSFKSKSTTDEIEANNRSLEEYTLNDGFEEKEMEDYTPLTPENMMSKAEYDQLMQNLSQTNKVVMENALFADYYDKISMEIHKFIGKQIELTGFVYKEDGLEQNQLVLSRFLITHCIADASIIGFLSEIPEASSIDQDSWIQATGVLDVTSYNGIELPVVKVTNWEKIDAPADPYLYPIITN